MEEDVWEFIRGQQRFSRFSEVKKAVPGINNQQLTNILRRLEKDGKLVRDVGYNKSRPVNNYLGVDLDDPGFRARITNDHGWLFVIFEWPDRSGTLRRSISMNMGELGDYVEPVGDELILKWPAWASRLAEAGRFSFTDIDHHLSLHG